MEKGKPTKDMGTSHGSEERELLSFCIRRSKRKKNGCTNAEIVAIPTEDVSLREVM